MALHSSFCRPHPDKEDGLLELLFLPLQSPSIDQSNHIIGSRLEHVLSWLEKLLLRCEVPQASLSFSPSPPSIYLLSFFPLLSSLIASSLQEPLPPLSTSSKFFLSILGPMFGGEVREEGGYDERRRDLTKT